MKYFILFILAMGLGVFSFCLAGHAFNTRNEVLAIFATVLVMLSGSLMTAFQWCWMSILDNKKG